MSSNYEQDTAPQSDTISVADLVAGILDPDSKVRPDRLATFAEGRFRDTVARLTDANLMEILAAVRTIF